MWVFCISTPSSIYHNQYLEVSSGAFAVESVSYVRAALDARGLAVLRVSTEGLTSPEIAKARKFAKGAQEIFQNPALDEDGNFIDEIGPDGLPTGVYISDYGTKQRRQRIMVGTKVLAKYRGEYRLSIVSRVDNIEHRKQLYLWRYGVRLFRKVPRVPIRESRFGTFKNKAHSGVSCR